MALCRNYSTVVVLWLLLPMNLHASEAPLGLRWGQTEAEIEELGVPLNPMFEFDEVSFSVQRGFRLTIPLTAE